MTYFAIDSYLEIVYSLAAPQGVNQKIFENLADGCQQLAGQIAIQHSAISQNKLRLEEKMASTRQS
jgi:hypothetical protein